MAGIRSAALGTGAAGGALFVLHGLIPGSRAYPLVWPFVAGAVAFWIATGNIVPHRFRHGMVAALAAGAVAGLVGLVSFTLIVPALTRPVLNPVAHSLGPRGPVLVALAMELGFASASAVAVVAAVVGGVVMMPVRWARQRRRDAPAV